MKTGNYITHTMEKKLGFTWWNLAFQWDLSGYDMRFD
jgi:hypothetical protein